MLLAVAVAVEVVIVVAEVVDLVAVLVVMKVVMVSVIGITQSILGDKNGKTASLTAEQVAFVPLDVHSPTWAIAHLCWQLVDIYADLNPDILTYIQIKFRYEI